MEGTRNERVGILIASYVIGFITAYIAFGVIQLEKSVEFVYVPVHSTAAVIESQSDVVTTKTTLTETDLGLLLSKDGVDTYLSARSTKESATDGYHEALAEYALSLDEKFVYFCEMPTVDSESCVPFVYSTETETVYPVTIDNQRVAFAANNHAALWTKEGHLIIESYFSEDPTRPWSL